MQHKKGHTHLYKWRNHIYEVIEASTYSPDLFIFSVDNTGVRKRVCLLNEFKRLRSIMIISRCNELGESLWMGIINRFYKLQYLKRNFDHHKRGLLI